MKFNVITLFPEFFDSPLKSGLISRAQESGLVSFDFVNPRSFATDRHLTVDDRPYGGGPGLVMLPKTLKAAIDSIEKPGRIFMLTPKGRKYDQAMARELSTEEDITLICGRYEGMDERLKELYPIEPVCVGDYVLNGGETGALNMIESAARLIPGFMHHDDSGDEESFSNGLLEYPHYTRPEEFEGVKVPEVLRQGHHGKIEQWRRERSLDTTVQFRPELLDEAVLNQADVDYLRTLQRHKLGRNLHLALVHYPVWNKFREKVAVSVTNLDIHDMSRCCRSYDLGGLYVVTPLEDQQELVRNLLGHWTEGAGGKVNPDRAEALSRTKVIDNLEAAALDILARTGQKPRLAATSARLDRRKKAPAPLTVGNVRKWLSKEPVLLVFGTGHGLAPQVVDSTEGILRPIRYLDDYNHLSVRSAVAITVDRLLADMF